MLVIEYFIKMFNFKFPALEQSDFYKISSISNVETFKHIFYMGGHERSFVSELLRNDFNFLNEWVNLCGKLFNLKMNNIFSCHNEIHPEINRNVFFCLW